MLTQPTTMPSASNDDAHDRRRQAASSPARGGSAAPASRVVILTGHPLATNPRAWKEADALARAGSDVEVLGGWITAEAKALDMPLVDRARFRFTAVVDLSGRSVLDGVRNFL